MSAQRTLLASDPHFVLERVELPSQSSWELMAERETWIPLLSGAGAVGGIAAAEGDAIFAQADVVAINTGQVGLVALVAYTASAPIPGILKGQAPPSPGTISTARGVARAIDLAVSQQRKVAFAAMRRVAFIGNHLPRRCGIATFTHDLHLASARSRPSLSTSIVAMNDTGHSYDYPAIVEVEVAADDIASYERAAGTINRSKADVVSLQHEFGIFGGAAGSHIVELMKRLSMPVVTTLHTVLAAPSIEQRVVMSEIIARSARLVVMSEKACAVLLAAYGVPAAMIDVIPHGIPDVPFADTHEAKLKLGFEGKTVILTFGLLSPGKGIETVIEAMPHILEACPNAVYVVLGASHPSLVRQHGEAYRESLQARAESLGLGGHVVFIDQFVDQATLLDFIAMSDVYVTPYLNEAQMTSGTLAYSFGLGKAVVSTPYWHASELLGDGRGVLVPFGDHRAIGREIASLATDHARRDAMRERAYAHSRSMTWAETASRYLATFDAVHAQNRPMPVAVRKLGPALPATPPEPRLNYFLSMCDSTGLLQHAVHNVPDRSHGYCVDDNARALLLAVAMGEPGERAMLAARTTAFAAFVEHAWNPDTRRFRNFMSYDRRWLEPQGSEDSHGRTLWALGACASGDPDPSRRGWAASLFERALPTVESFTSPRAWAFTLLGLDSYCGHVGDNAQCMRLRSILAERLLSALRAVETADWVWFENELAYDNARLPEALLVTGTATANQTLVDAGIRSLRWLNAMQTAPAGHYRPVGTESFGCARRSPRAFDQQPLEAAATISACYAAWRADRDAVWPATASTAFAWFVGRNDLATSLVDTATGGCRDGLHPDRANENCGAESVLAYLLATVDMRRFARAASIEVDASTTVVRARGDHARVAAMGPAPGGYLVSRPGREAPNVTAQTGPGAGRGQAIQTGDRT